MKTATIGIALAMLAASGAAQGAECVNAKTAKAGFALEMPGIRGWFRSPTHTSPNRRRRSSCLPG